MVIIRLFLSYYHITKSCLILSISTLNLLRFEIIMQIAPVIWLHDENNKFALSQLNESTLTRLGLDLDKSCQKDTDYRHVCSTQRVVTKWVVDDVYGDCGYLELWRWKEKQWLLGLTMKASWWWRLYLIQPKYCRHSLISILSIFFFWISLIYWKNPISHSLRNHTHIVTKLIIRVWAKSFSH